MIYYRAFRVTDLSTLILLEQPQRRSAKVPFYRRRAGIITIILSIITIGAIIAGVEGTKSALRNSTSDSTTTAFTSIITTTTALPVAPGASTTTMFTTVTTTTTMPAPTSSCIWEGTAPFCDGKCHPGFTQIQMDNCGNGACCIFGLKVYCCPS